MARRARLAKTTIGASLPVSMPSSSAPAAGDEQLVDAAQMPTSRPAAETERTAGATVLCAICGTPMKGRRPQARFCSDACRARGGRRERDLRVAALMDGIDRVVHDLRKELIPSIADGGASMTEESQVHQQSVPDPASDTDET